MSDDAATALLLLLRLKAFAPSSELAGALDIDVESVETRMRELRSEDWVQHRDGPAAGWSLTPAGRRHGQDRLRQEIIAAARESEVLACYQGFLPLNGELLSICTDWQTVVVGGEHVPNDHADPLRDAAILERLDSLHLGALPVLQALSDASGRFAPYAGRLERAHRHVRDGRTEWIAKPTVDSYHGIWFELHEHLLVTLGRAREDEPLPSYAPTESGERS